MSGRRMVPAGFEVVARWILAALGALSLSSCYVTVQGSRYLALRARAVRAERVLADPESSREAAGLVRRAEAVRSFATAVLGLADTRSYRALVELDSDRLATVVSACDPVSFHRYLWRYPLVGALPTKATSSPGKRSGRRNA
ncbi:MAG: aminopeptidase [Desulfomicrobium escambiense]|nr:aminopeptidase [Desulfomicrobium escambiense]